MVIIGRFVYCAYLERIELQEWRQALSESKVIGKTRHELTAAYREPDWELEERDGKLVAVYYDGPSGATCRISFDVTGRASKVEHWVK